METYTLDQIEIVGDSPTVCQWFLNCHNAPSHLVSHPILEWVPTCERCLKKLGEN